MKIHKDTNKQDKYAANKAITKGRWIVGHILRVIESELCPIFLLYGSNLMIIEVTNLGTQCFSIYFTHSVVLSSTYLTTVIWCYRSLSSTFYVFDITQDLKASFNDSSWVYIHNICSHDHYSICIKTIHTWTQVYTVY